MEQTRENPLGREKIGALRARFAVPSIITMLVSAATNVAFPLTSTYTGLSLLCGIGGAANFNLCMGRKEAVKAERFAGAAIGMMLILGMVLCIGTRLFLRPLILILSLFLGIGSVMYAAPVADFIAAVLAVLFVTREFARMKKEGEALDGTE